MLDEEALAALDRVPDQPRKRRRDTNVGVKEHESCSQRCGQSCENCTAGCKKCWEGCTESCRLRCEGCKESCASCGKKCTGCFSTCGDACAVCCEMSAGCCKKLTCKGSCDKCTDCVKSCIYNITPNCAGRIDNSSAASGTTSSMFGGCIATVITTIFVLAITNGNPANMIRED